MTNITIPLQKEYIDFIDDTVKEGNFDNRSQFIRNAIKKMIEEQEIAEILEASEQIKRGECFEGDLQELAKKIK
jgi:Arc/MetJ-type ribon-helix-helix transcriptional regulator